MKSRTIAVLLAVLMDLTATAGVFAHQRAEDAKAVQRALDLKYMTCG